MKGERMVGKKKKIAAALAAVSAYLQEEEAAAMTRVAAAVPGPPANEFSHWGQSGRQEMMAMRKLVQLRVFTRF